MLFRIPFTGRTTQWRERTAYGDGVGRSRARIAHVALSWKDYVPSTTWGTHHEGVGRDPSWLAEWPLHQPGGSQVPKGRAWKAKAVCQLIWLCCHCGKAPSTPPGHRHLLHLKATARGTPRELWHRVAAGRHRQICCSPAPPTGQKWN